jgi:hypothetical protein
MVWVATPLAILCSSGCGKDTTTETVTSASTTSTTSTTSAAVTGVADVDPAVARPSSDTAYQWSTSFTVTLTETAGVATTIRSLSADLQQAAGGIVIVPPTGLDESFRFQVRASGNRLDAKGTTTVAFDFSYSLPNGGREALVTVTFNLTDDNGATAQVVIQVKVA